MVSVVSWVDFSIDAFWTDGLSGDSAFGKYAVCGRLKKMDT